MRARQLAFFFGVVDIVQGQGALGGGAPAQGADTTASVVTTTSYINGPTVAEPPVNTGPWQDADHLEGTWSSKSMMVMTGPDFYDPVDELLIEPALPGISFSFTKDGYFEQAMYQVTADAGNNSCSTAALTFQHGTYNVTDGKLKMYPFVDDGRQLVSDPCNSNYSNYVQYDQELTMSKFEVTVDMYYGRYRLDLFQFDGTPMAPLYLVYRPPQMLPTSTLNPGVKNRTEAANNGETKRQVSSNVRERIKRSLINRSRTTAKRDQTKPALYNTVWWGGVGMMTFGAAAYVYLS